MSTAHLVPETFDLDGDDAAGVLRHARFKKLLVDSVKRFRTADGMSHSRSLAFATLLTVIPGVIAVVGFANVVGVGSVRDAVNELITELAPGPSGQLLTDAISQGNSTSSDNGVVPLVFGLLAMALSGITAFGQIERGANRVYGIEQDRPFTKKYGQAAKMFGVAMVVGTAVLVALGGTHEARMLGTEVPFTVVKSVVGLAIVAVLCSYVFRVSPRRRQPHVSWLIVGSSISTVLWLIATAGLAIFWRVSGTFGETYGPLAGVMALGLWAYLISIGLFLGIAFAAQLEAVRADRNAGPQDVQKVTHSEPGQPITSPGPVPLGS